ncbi:MAG: hypothetical protein EOO45_18750 [Flavobacterium sp.]|nr:MAG: hypothetical protein EOO45_18750 [Flavobacterium sp.]
MKRKFAIFNLVLMAVVLLTTAYQSFHAFSHKHLQDHAHHEVKKESRQFSSDNHGEDEECATCDFHFDYFVAPQGFCLRLDFPFRQIPYTFNTLESNTFFSGSLFSLRAPPAV